MRPLRIVLLLAIAVYLASVASALGVFSNGSARGTASAAEYEYGGKVTICHRTGKRNRPTETITVDGSSLQKHLNHGDTLGPCP
jgi:hypothetical protein